MSDDLIAALRERGNILHASAAWGSDEDGILMHKAADALERKAALINEASAYAPLDLLERMAGDEPC